MNHLSEVLATVYTMSKGQIVTFTSGATVERTGRNAYKVTDKNSKVYSSLDRDMAAMIAHKGE